MTRDYSESREQRKFFAMLQLRHPEIRQFTFSIPNGGKRTSSEAYRMVAEGLTKGVLDVMIAYPVGKHPGMFIEFKSETGSLTSEQRSMMYRFLSVGYRCYVCRSCEEAMQRVEEYLELDAVEHKI